MKYALIGCGRIATNHIKAATDNNLEIAGVCDIIPQNMEMLLQRHGLAGDTHIARFTNYRAMLQAVRPQFVAIATESGNHASIARSCIARGIHVIIEKPIALNMRDANEIVRCASEKGVVVSACHQNRFNIAVQQLRRALEAGRFGRLSHGSVHVRWNRNRAYYRQAPWRGTWAQDGGALMNQCIHGIDLLRWMMGDEIDTVFAATCRQFHSYIEAEDIGMAVIRFKNGALATVEGTTNVYPSNLEESLYIFGENGTVKLGGKAVNSVDVWQFADETGGIGPLGFEEQTVNVYGNGHPALYADVLEAIETGRPPYVDAAAGRNALELVLSIYKSQKTGKPVSLPLDDFGTMDMMNIFGGPNDGV